MGFFSRIEARARKIDSLLCIGLDSHPQELPIQSAQAAAEHCLRLIEASAHVALAYKPNSAFFEAFGPQGMEALRRVIRSVPEGIPVILDAKRGDVASTSQAYARACYEVLGAQAVTVNPYLGYDAIAPFLADPERGVFLLCRTSNPGAADLQELMVIQDIGLPVSQAMPLYEQVAMLAQAWAQADNLGLVVGATQPQALARVRTRAPSLWILAPGIGPQGGDLQAALRAGLRADGLGLLLPVSREISRAADPRQAAERLRAEINRARANRRHARSDVAEDAGPPGLTPPFAGEVSRLADSLLESGCVRFAVGKDDWFLLKAGARSPVYIDLRRLVSYPVLLERVAAAYVRLLGNLRFDRLAALPYAALPIATAICLQGGWPMVYPRKEAKAYGTRADVEGAFTPGERVVLVDDLATTGGSKFEAINKLNQAGLQVQDVVVLIDRQSGAGEALQVAGYKLHAVFTLSELLDHWQDHGLLTAGQAKIIREFLQSQG